MVWRMARSKDIVQATAQIATLSPPALAGLGLLAAVAVLSALATSCAPPTAPGMVVVSVPRLDAKNCYRSATPIPEVVTFEAATQAAKNQKWLDVRAGEGAQWLEQHRARVDELLDRAPPAPKPGIESPTVTPVP